MQENERLECDDEFCWLYTPYDNTLPASTSEDSSSDESTSNQTTSDTSSDASTESIEPTTPNDEVTITE